MAPEVNVTKKQENRPTKTVTCKKAPSALPTMTLKTLSNRLDSIISNVVLGMFKGSPTAKVDTNLPPPVTEEGAL